jgi:hypothetical protein
MICAIDCDLRTSYCVFEDGRAGRGPYPFAALAECDSGPAPDTVLFEIASPISFNRQAGGKAVMYQLAKWAIYNAAHAMSQHLFHHFRPGCRLLVAPSNEWTRGFDLKTRHAMARCQQKKKDLRECEAMIWFYKARPECWKPLPDYLASL